MEKRVQVLPIFLSSGSSGSGHASTMIISSQSGSTRIYQICADRLVMAKIPDEAESIRFVVHVISDIQLAVYVVIAALFSIVAVVSLYDAVKEIIGLFSSTDLQVGIVGVLEALLLSITVLTLLTTVTVYFQTRHFEPRPLLIAGLTSMIRHVIVSNVAVSEPIQIFGTVAVLAVLIAGIVLTRQEGETDHIF